MNVKHDSQPTKAYKLWDAGDVETVSMSDLKRRRDLQPRDPSVIRSKHRRADQEMFLKEMMDTFVKQLQEYPEVETKDPIKVARIDGELLVVDGHHRVQVYKKARRKEIPAIVHNTDLATARLASRWSNTQGTTVGLHKDEVIEAAWKTMSELSDYGELTWEEVNAGGHSYKTVLEMLGGQPGRHTLTRMKAALPRIREDGFTEVDWPKWKDARVETNDLPEFDPDQEEEATIALFHSILKAFKKHPSRRAEEVTRRLHDMIFPEEVEEVEDDSDLY